MATLKVISLPILLILSAFSISDCTSTLQKKSFLKDKYFTWIYTDSSFVKIDPSQIGSSKSKINPADLLGESEIVHSKDHNRSILASSPFAMKEIFFQSGCFHGSQVKQIIKTKLIDQGVDRWTAICENGEKDEIEFRVFGFGSEEIYHFQKLFLKESIQKAQKSLNEKKYEKAKIELEKILEFEPALPFARFNLGIYFLQKKECEKAKRHFRIFLRLSPNHKDQEKILQKIKETCT